MSYKTSQKHYFSASHHERSKAEDEVLRDRVPTDEKTDSLLGSIRGMTMNMYDVAQEKMSQSRFHVSMEIR